MALSPQDLEALRGAVQSLEHPGLATRLTNMVGTPVELVGRMLPASASQLISSATTKGLEVALNLALRTMDRWRTWLAPEHRCVVPWTSFCEWADTKPRKTPTWFAFTDERPLAVFAGIWTTWRGRRGTKINPIEGEHQLFGFLTTNANDVVGTVHPKAMPVILSTETEIEQWMTAPADQALQLQRPLPNGSLKIVMTGEKEDQSA